MKDDVAAVRAALHTYYDTEKNSLPVIMAATIFVMSIGIALIKQAQVLSKGIGWSILGMSLLSGVAVLIYAFQLKPQKAIYENLLDTDPPNYCSQEMAHLNKMQENFRRVILTDLILAGLGLMVFGLGRQQDRAFVQGFGLGMTVVFLLQTGLELYNLRRILSYREKVLNLQKLMALDN